jgi:hypothetical protein
MVSTFDPSHYFLASAFLDYMNSGFDRTLIRLNLSHDTDADGIPDIEDEDIDGDGLSNDRDEFPYTAHIDVPDVRDVNPVLSALGMIAIPTILSPAAAIISWKKRLHLRL